MGLSGCGPRSCECGIVSNSLSVALVGDVFTIEALAFMNVTSGTRPSSPTLWQHIFETDTQRYRTWDGTNWVIVGGSMPAVQLERDAALAIGHNSVTGVTLPNEMVDSDGFHSGSSSAATIPAGYGGDYIVQWYLDYDANATGYRAVFATITNNATPTPAQISSSRTGGTQLENTLNNGFSGSRRIRLEAGATVTLQTIQTSGGSLDVLHAALSLTMVTHIPSLT